MSYISISHCPICNSERLKSFLTLPNLPLYCNLLWSDQTEAINCRKGDIKLAVCCDCGFILNTDFDPTLLDYSQQYENSLHFSPRFQAYAQDLAKRLVEKHQLFSKKILEIGCGKGDFLEMLCQMGNNSGIGFDSSYVPERAHSNRDIVFIQDTYSDKYLDYTADFICCRQVLEHIQDPLSFLELFKQVALGNPETNLFFEVPNSAYIFENMSIWDIIYEHCNYFTQISLAYVFEQAGFFIKALNEEFSGQFLSIEATTKLRPFSSDKSSKSTSLNSLLLLLETFKQRLENKLSVYSSYLTDFQAENKSVAIWGTGSKGVTFLNLLNSEKGVNCAVDINPKKQGKFVAGTGQPIIAPDDLKRSSVDTVLIMNPLYEDEIKLYLASMELYPETLVVQ